MFAPSHFGSGFEQITRPLFGGGEFPGFEGFCRRFNRPISVLCRGVGEMAEGLTGACWIDRGKGVFRVDSLAADDQRVGAANFGFYFLQRSSERGLVFRY